MLLAHALDDSAPAVDGLSQDLQGKVDVIVQALAGAKKPLIISGTNAGSMEIIQAAANVAKALKGRGADVGVTMVARAVNSVGLGMIGGGSLEEALDELESGAADALSCWKTTFTVMLPPRALTLRWRKRRW
ncbi:NADH-ubiquinone oxidoreductase subunit G [Klebsiella pneumoniae]|uniref:NADH-ubiquinone oxidoreductase subunit G n=1 Tax=Klebsiella pneumoniae TaxID=573 RepID=A0A378G154_KLEPN|nr:NADH-ubiquinone oxidoreductase subunit G [Klebsiella pneumoniae]